MRGALAAFACAFVFAACDDAAGPSETPRAKLEAAPARWFTDVTASSGIDFVHDAGTTPEKHLPETMGAGGALVDVDGDGDLDLYLLQGGPMRLPGAEPGAFVEPSGPLPTNRLYLNDGSGHFRDATAESGDAAHTGYAMGVAAGDVDGDGKVDLYVTNLGADVLLRGDGHGRFRDVTRESGLHDPRWTTACQFFDADGDGDLDLFVTGYVLIDLAHPLWCGERREGWRTACHPDAYAGLQDRLWINRGDGTFEDATESSGVSASFGKGLGVIAVDVERDGDLDLYVANDSTENDLWLNDGHGHFSDATMLAGVGVDGRGLTEASMGLASGDVDGDLDLDLVVTAFDDESDTLYVNDGKGLFTDLTIEAGLEAVTRLPVGFGIVLEDFDLDGDLDLAIANGHIIDNIALYHDGKTHAQRAYAFENDGRGHFRELKEEAGDFSATPFVGRGLYAGDLDGDGDADLVMTQCGGPTRVFRNERGRGASITIRGAPRNTELELVGRSGTRRLRESGAQPSYIGQSSPDVIASLGGDELVRMLVRAPYSEPAEIAIDPPVARGTIVLERAGASWRTKIARR